MLLLPLYLYKRKKSVGWLYRILATIHVVIFIYLTVPVTLVDYYRADYSSNRNYQFYFVFLREVLVGINGLEVTAIDISVVILV